MSDKFNVGSIVKARNREWIVLPSTDADTVLLRPLGGSEKEISGIYLPLNLEKLEPASFPKPSPEKIGDLISTRLLRDAARLTFRSGAGPFRSLGKLSVRPRPYQFVPLLMALRQDVIRLLIADDVGVGKTVEALLIARELYDRGEIKSIGVVCPPHLCDQWQKEVLLKFNLNAVIIRSNTISQLERAYSDNSISVFSYYNFFITSIDYIKSEKRRDTFLQNLPDFVIVDEAHTCTKPIDNDKAQQQRFELVSDIAKSKNSNQNLVLLTATPHSGKEESFLSLIGHLKNDFTRYDVSSIDTEERIELAKYFIQRKRGDVEKWVGVDTPFPKRFSEEESYKLSPEYAVLFSDVYRFLLGLLVGKDKLAAHKQRVRYWAALGLLRSIMSSPDTGVNSLMNRITKLKDVSTIQEEFDDTLYRELVTDPIEKETTSDLEPSTIVQEAEEEFSDSERRKLKEFALRLEKLRGDKDAKLKKLISLLKKFIAEGFRPIVFCRFIATSDYVAAQLKNAFPAHQILSITSELSEEEREEKISWLSEYDKRILVATDCLSEGVNLQDHFDSVIHYDLPWNPNRLEQREGRIDRFGQKKKEVKTVLLYGEDNPIDGAVLNVLIRKAVKIHKTLGITVPVPMNSETVIQSVINSLFMKEDQKLQLSLDFGPEFHLEQFNAEWDRNAEREKESRSRFAQHSIKPEEVSKELEETDVILGNPLTVQEFIIASAKRLGGSISVRSDGVTLNPNGFPALLREKIKLDDKIDLAFDFPIPEKHIEVGRNHPLTSAIAEYILESSFEVGNNTHIYRTSAIRTDKVDKVTSLYLLRVRYLIESPRTKSSLLAEELVSFGFYGDENNPNIISDVEANDLLAEIKASEGLDPDYAKELVAEALKSYDKLDKHLKTIIDSRKEKLLTAHTRLRKITKESKIEVKPQFPVDVLGIIVLVPTPKGIN